VKVLGVEVGDERRKARAARRAARAARPQRRAARCVADSPASRARLAELQKWQSQRLLKSHADLRASPRYRAAVEFFFKELYSGGDPRVRDRDLAARPPRHGATAAREALRALMLAIELEIHLAGTRCRSGRGLPAGPITVAGLRPGVPQRWAAPRP